MAPPIKNIAGKRYGMLTVNKFVRMAGHHSMWECECDCGNNVIVRSNSMRRGLTKSCGCLKKSILADRNFRHGLSTHPLYRVWTSIRARCYRETETAFKYYGARGIGVCEEWRNSFDSFFEWAEPRWEKGLSLDRINTNGDYEPDNCRFTTMGVQALNRRVKRGNSSGITGVSWNKEQRKWAANGSAGGEKVFLGYYNTKSAAKVARQKWFNTVAVPFIERNSNV